jgi:hypothetical protein
MLLWRRLYKIYEVLLATEQSAFVQYVPARRSPSASAAMRTSGSSIDSTLPPRLRLSGVSRSMVLGDSMSCDEDVVFGDSCEGPG